MNPPHTLPAALLIALSVACAAPPTRDFSATRERAQRAQDRNVAPARTASPNPPPPSAPDTLDGSSPTDIRRLEASYPPDTYLLGVGESPDGPLPAEYAARAQVARQIQAVLETSLYIETRGTLADAQTTVEEAVRETSRFDRGELISLLREHSSCNDGTCRAVVILHRPSASEALLEEIAPALDEYDRTIQRAVETRDPWTFTPLWRSVATQSAALHARLQIIQSVAGRPPTALVTLRQRERSLADHRSVLLREHDLALGLLHVDDPSLHEVLNDVLRRTLGEAGASIRSATTCTSGARIDLHATVQCQQSFVGIRCSLDGALTSQTCSNGTELGSTRLSGCAAGAHPSDEARARTALAQSIREPRFTTCLRDALGSWWPLH